MISFRYVGGDKWMKGYGSTVLPTAPIQNEKLLTVPMLLAEEAYKEYAAQYGTSQTLTRINERHGFGIFELAHLLYDRIKRIEDGAAKIAEAGNSAPNKPSAPEA